MAQLARYAYVMGNPKCVLQWKNRRQIVKRNRKDYENTDQENTSLGSLHIS